MAEYSPMMQRYLETKEDLKQKKNIKTVFYFIV